MARQSFPLVDLCKMIAAQMIVLHHLAWFGPMSDVAAAGMPWAADVQSWLAEFGRYAVAVFLVISGFLAAQTLQSGHFVPTGRLLLDRYVRLVAPFAVALLLAIASTMLARQWMTHDSIGMLPNLKQLLAHLLLVHDLMGFEALSAGVWYVAIDFQLYALLVGLLWLSGHLHSRLASVDFWVPVLVGGMALASLFYFNLDAAWDATALYFFGSYGLGVAAAWATRLSRPGVGLLMVAMTGGLALFDEFRPRIAVALATALLLGWGASLSLRLPPFLMQLSRHSYALFLVHFPVCLLVNAAVTRWVPDHVTLNAAGVVLAWLASNIAASIFHRQVELRLGDWRLLRLKPA